MFQALCEIKPRAKPMWPLPQTRRGGSRVSVREELPEGASDSDFGCVYGGCHKSLLKEVTVEFRIEAAGGKEGKEDSGP